MTLDPLEELFAECLDGINYAESLAADHQFGNADRQYMKFVANQLVGIAHSLQNIRNTTTRTYTPQEIPFPKRS